MTSTIAIVSFLLLFPVTTARQITVHESFFVLAVLILFIIYKCHGVHVIMKDMNIKGKNKGDSYQALTADCCVAITRKEMEMMFSMR